MPNSCTVCMYNSGKNKDISFFSYPRNHLQRREWLQIVGRQDLIGKLEHVKARRNYRICEQHFEKNFITFSKHRTVKYLTENAYPTLNLPFVSDGASTRTSQYESITAIDNQICENISASTSPSQYEGITAINNENSKNIPLVIDIKNEKSTILSDQLVTTVQVDLPDLSNKMDGSESKSSQTTLHLSANTPRKRKLSLELREPKKSKTLDLNCVTKKDFLKLCDKFLNKNMAQLIKWQIDLKMGYSDSKDEDETFWNFIEYSKSKAYCSICKEPLPRRGADLKRHISIYHPDHAANSNTNSDNEATDKDTEEASGDIFTEVIYLEDHGQPADSNGPIRIRDFSKPRKPHKYVKAKPYERIPKLERTHNAVNSTNDIGNHNNLEDFTRYILSLLKALPQHATNKLQLDIINMILKTKMEHEAPVLSLPVAVSPATEHAGVSYVVNEVSNQPSSPNLMINIAAAET